MKHACARCGKIVKVRLSASGDWMPYPHKSALPDAGIKYPVVLNWTGAEAQRETEPVWCLGTRFPAVLEGEE